MDPHEIKFLNALNSVRGVGTGTLRLLKNRFETYENAWRASESDLRACGVPAPAAEAIARQRPLLNPDRELERVVRANVWIITDGDPHYPRHLAEIPQPPLALYGKGERGALEKTATGPSVAVVGTRRPTAYGLEMTERLVARLVDAGVAIVSGLAVGIDTRAHRTALEAGGKTIAVLGSGIDRESLFPPENAGLAERIAESGGVVVSEYPPGTPALKEHFPQRNRIISGLSAGVLVVEAREKSGALITARLALEQNRDVFAVPGSIISATSAGPNLLIQQGAKLVLAAADVLQELGIEEATAPPSASAGSPAEAELLTLLEEPLSVDFIREQTGWKTSAVLASLSLLELKGLVKKMGTDVYQRIG